jgi:hypothetical protein
VATTRASSEKRGEVLAMLRELLAEGRTDDVLAMVSQLVARNSELERRLAQVLSGGRKNEGVPTAQLQLILDKIEVEAGSDENGLDPAIAAASKKLREASGIDKTDERTEDKEAGRRKRQRPLRRTIPASLPRVDNPIKVPDAERACPACGGRSAGLYRARCHRGRRAGAREADRAPGRPREAGLRELRRRDRARAAG